MSFKLPDNPGSHPHPGWRGNIGVRRLIERKRAAEPPLDRSMIGHGFRGWHERGYLPHCDLPHVTQMVTFMLADSFPVSRRAEWEPILHEADESQRRRKLEEWLDRGHGECWLQDPRVAALVEEALRQLDGAEYQLHAWVIMPNHVHVVVGVYDTPLSRLLKRWKGGTARQANRVLGRQGAFWQEDYFDTRIRDANHLAQAIRYVEQNPTKAHLVLDPHQWPWSSARLRDEYNRLPWQAQERGL